MNYKKELENISLELKRQSDLILSPKVHQTNSLLHALVQSLNSNKVKIAEYNARLNTIEKYNTMEKIKNDLEVLQDYTFTEMCIANIERINNDLQTLIDKILNNERKNKP